MLKIYQTLKERNINVNGNNMEWCNGEKYLSIKVSYDNHYKEVI